MVYTIKPKATGNFNGEYMQLQVLDRTKTWSGDVWVLEENEREIPEFSIDIVTWTPLMKEPVRFWPPRRRLRVRDPVADPEAAPQGDGEEPPLLFDDGPEPRGSDGTGGGECPGAHEEEDMIDIEMEALLDEWGMVLGEGADAGGEGAGGEPPPPPAPHPVVAKGRGKGERRHYANYQIFDGDNFECGHILMNVKGRSFDVHCAHHSGDCAIGRTWVPYEGGGNLTALRASKGRPLAFLVAWCRMGWRYPDTPEGRAAHMEAKSGRTELSRPLQDGNSDIRRSCREYVEESPHLADLRAQERQPRADEPLEPRGGV